MIKTIKDVDLKGKKVLLRCDFNVPLDENQNITDTSRIEAALPTIDYILKQGCSLILLSHLGRPKGKRVKELSLSVVADKLSEFLNKKVKFCSDCVGEEVKKIADALQPGEILLLENLRYHPEEEANDEKFAAELASLGEIFVQDAFGTIHRAHASTVGITKFLPAVAGFLLEKEIKYLKDLLENPPRPFLTILGGAKVSTKIGIIKNLLEKVDSIIIGGGMAYTFLKAEGIDVGNSLVEEDKIPLARQILNEADQKKVSIILVSDHIVADKISADAEVREISDVRIPIGWIGVDIGSTTIKRFVNSVIASRAILWNGPMGIFEIDKFSKGTKAIAEAIATATKNGAISVIGGGDTAAAVKKFKMEKSFTHISTGGGASLEFLEGKELPGIAVLQDK